MSADASLLRRYVDSRDESAFAEFVRRHVDLVYFAALRRTGDNAALARDVAQHVFTEVARRAGALARHPTVEGWLYTTTRNVALKLLRDERARREREREFSAMQAINGTAPAVDWERLQPWIDDALDELGAADREAIVLRFFGRRTFADIGTAARISEDAARMRVERALGRLRSRLEKRGLASTTALLGTALGQHALHATPATLAATLAQGALTAGPAAALVAAGGFAAFMSSTKIITATAVAALLVAGLARYEVREERAWRAAAAAAQREEQALAASVAQARQRVSVLERELAAGPPPTPTPPAPATARPADPASERELGDALLAADPELKKAATLVTTASQRLAFFPLYRELNLTDAQIAEFETILGAGRSFSTSVPRYPRIELVPFPPVTSEEKEQRLRALLGDAGRRRMEEYERTRSDALPRIAAELAFTATPLHPEQVRQLSEVVTTYRSKQPPGQTLPAKSWAGIMAEAGRFLSEPQLAALDHQRAYDIYIATRLQTPTSAAK